MSKEHKILLIRIIVAAVLTAALIALRGTLLIALPWPVMLALCVVPYLIVGYDVLLEAAEGIVHGEFLDECFLMTVATLGAFVLGCITDGGDCCEAPAVMLFYQIGELFQDMAVDKSRSNIEALMDIRPDHANVIDPATGALNVTAPDRVAPGTLILIKPGEKVPIDGVVESGESAVDTAALTGESVPRTMRPGDEVLSGAVNLTSELRLRTVRPFGESAVSRILELVKNAESRKARPENFITKFARIYTPVVCIAAVLLALVPPLVSLLLHASPDWSVWLYRALAFLVASCPCALVVSIPLGFFAGLGGAGREGILIKGSGFLEALSRTDTVMFDKTGTLTEGNFEVAEVVPAATSGFEGRAVDNAARLLELAAHAELDSSHPIGLSLIRAYGAAPDRARVTNIVNVSGKGVRACVDGHRVAVGNNALMLEEGALLPAADTSSPASKPEVNTNSSAADTSSSAPASASVPASASAAGTLVFVAVDNQYAGRILIADRQKPTAAAAIAALRELGIRRTVMLTGDREETARAVAAGLGLDGYHAELLPEDKVRKLEALEAQQKPGASLAFVGDGINDAPVLVRADVGIAMGGIGSDAAIEAADVVLMDDDPVKLGRSIRIARKCMRIVIENIVFSIAVKLLSLVLVATGVAGMWLAVFADVGVMVLCVLNAIRALRTR